MDIVTSDQLKERIEEALDPIFVSVEDVSDGCGQKFEIVVASGQFAGVAMLAQHRLVNKAIEEYRDRIHALSLKTMTPEKWEKQKSNIDS
mmetsp:Transcript_10506/g.15992  ORF Transcript_10506/g.15992 Transcript_10506/m.15992 type:complete len:90 (+) Transcript_10506:78-347(+)|eukprot:CAMPEP_0185025776 /NCGR_PEP_ID=MMETSP1103-20130426/9237_1 /TAXON_ID=36769 /ORGANISM="Paraphysomonas bandaiensis, Strain Caron Lab Isolate" /LENGTH=89 /DNA_ID=CAMNT_0027559107 /DNA_START=16 /DNA_END=285 /DNA_ORIENTATION=+